MWRRPHPFVLLVSIPSVARVLGLCSHYFAADPSGHPVVPSPLTSLVVALPYHLIVLGAFAGLGMLAWNLIPRARIATAAVWGLFAPFAVFVGETDRQLFRFLGHGLSWATIHTYAGPSVFGGEVLQPLANDWPHLAVSLGLIGASAVLAAWSAARAAVESPHRRVGWALTLLCLVAPIALVAGPFRHWWAPPPEVSLLRSMAGLDTTPRPADEAGARRELREFVGASRPLEWIDPAVPLLRPVPADATSSAGAADRPDIVVLVVESLRGADVGFSSGRTPSITPTLDALAAGGVAVPRFIANGVFSSVAFMTIHTSTWPHRNRLLTADFPEVARDSFAVRLKELGYETVAISGSNPNFDNMLVWFRRWYDRVDFEMPGNQLLYTRRMSDSDLVDRMIGDLDRHDREAPGRPLLLYASTAGTHSPFTLEDSYFVPLTAAGDASRVDTRGIADPQERYDVVLANFDRQLRRLTDRLAARRRRNRTVLLILGDHAFFTNESLTETLRSMPVDPLVWTSAIVAGAPELVGPPRRIEEVCSQVDVMPTILGVAGDRRPTAAIGRDLVHEPPSAATISIRPDGIRLDRAGRAAMFLPGNPDQAWTFEPFRRDTSYSRSLEGTPFTREELARVDRLAGYWSYLLERNRAWKVR